EHRLAENGARGKLLRLLAIGELVDRRLAIFHQPELHGQWLAVLPCHAEAKRACCPLLLGERAEEREGALLGPPARPVNVLISGPGRVIEAVEDLDVEPGGLRLALCGASELPPALCPIG